VFRTWRGEWFSQIKVVLTVHFWVIYGGGRIVAVGAGLSPARSDRCLPGGGEGSDVEAADVVDRHVQGDPHRPGVVLGLGEQVAAFQGAHEAGGQSFGFGVGA